MSAPKKKGLGRGRGCPKGAGTHVGRSLWSDAPAGRIGNPPIIPTEEQRQEVRTLSRVLNMAGVAAAMGMSTDTIKKHFRDEWREGHARSVAAAGARLLKTFINENGTVNDRNLRYYLTTQGREYGWTPRYELTGKDGGPVEMVDLAPAFEGISDDEISAAIPIFELVLTRLSADGVPVYAAPGPDADEGRALKTGT